MIKAILLCSENHNSLEAIRCLEKANINVSKTCLVIS